MQNGHFYYWAYLITSDKEQGTVINSVAMQIMQQICCNSIKLDPEHFLSVCLFRAAILNQGFMEP